MPWPDIFFKGRKSRPASEAPPSLKTPPPAETLKPVDATAAETKALHPKPAPSPVQTATPPAIKPVPVVVKPTPAMVPQPPKPIPVEAGTRTLPAMHGVVLRPPTRMASTTVSLSVPGQNAPPRTTEPIKNIEQLMAEADPVRTLSQTGSVRMLKRLTPEPATAKRLTEPPGSVGAPTNTQAETTGPLPIKPQPSLSSSIAPSRPPPAASIPPTPRVSLDVPPPFPTFQPAGAAVPQPPPPHLKKPQIIALRPGSSVMPTAPSVLAPTVKIVAPAAAAAPAASTPQPTPTSTGALPQEKESPFILKPSVSLVSTPKIIPPSAPPAPPLMPFGVFRRKAKMNDLARIVLPSKREDHEPSPAPPESAPTVIPPAFPVSVATPGHALPSPSSVIHWDELPKPDGTVPAVLASAPTPRIEEKSDATVPPPFPNPAKVEPGENKPPLVDTLPPPVVQEAPNPAPSTAPLPKVGPEVGKPEVLFTPAPPAEFETRSPEPSFTTLPKVESKADSAAPKPVPSITPAARIEPEASKPAPEPAAATLPSEPRLPAIVPEKREFHLANGERVAGNVLSETPEAIYIEHGTLGVLTIPRNQIAKRLVEIILINGDRIVGDIMAETADTLYVRHASLGMLTVPRAQRSTRVVEAILKDGDRILGEVLSETETFTVIKSATLGTVTVPHNKVTMLNRKIEQIELKTLPPPAPEIKDKP